MRLFPATRELLRWMSQASERFFSTINPLSLEWYDSFIELMIANLVGLTLPVCILYDLINYFAHCADVTAEEVANQRVQEQARLAEAELEAERIELEKQRLIARVADVEEKRVNLEMQKIGKQKEIARRYERMRSDVKQTENLPIDVDEKQAMVNQIILVAANDIKRLL